MTGLSFCVVSSVKWSCCHLLLGSTGHTVLLNMLIAGHQWLTSVILATWEAEIGRNMGQGQPEKIVHKAPSPTFKLARAKWTEDVTQVVQCLLCKV
jgi:hypothetical protein